ncbi:MAG TPA: helix-turn-helix domain-containing protein, partial [Limnobacter sp.]|nr:helix-turn-helix domain-containing protein [Limnobacter sp.]
FLSTSPTLEGAAKIIEWLPALLVPEFRFSVQTSAGHVAFQVDIEGADSSSTAVQGVTDTVVACAVLFMRKLLPEQAQFEIHLAHPAGTQPQVYSQALGQLPRFNSSFNGLLMPQAELYRPIAGKSGRVNAMTALVIENTIRSMESSRKLSDQVLKLLSRQPAATVDEISALLDMPVRTLQRRLQEENTSFQSLMNEAQCSLAKHYLANPQLDVESIALKLGFSDRHSFTRAFKRWTGSTPSAWRQAST